MSEDHALCVAAKGMAEQIANAKHERAGCALAERNLAQKAALGVKKDSVKPLAYFRTGG